MRVVALLLLLVLTGCAGKSVLDGGTSLTIQTANPVRGIDIYRTKNAYAATLELVVAYRAYCWSKPRPQLMLDPVAARVCKDRRRAVVFMQAAQVRAGAAIRRADQFAGMSSISAADAVMAAWDAVKDFQLSIPK